MFKFLLIPNLILLWEEKPFEFNEALFSFPAMVSPSECTCGLEENTLCEGAGERARWFVHGAVQIFYNFTGVWTNCSINYRDRIVKISYYDCDFVYFSL